MRSGPVYMKKNAEEYAEHQRARLEKNLHRRAQELGYELKKSDPPETGPPPEPPAMEDELKS